MSATRVCAVIVAYHYPWNKLRELIRAIANQLECIVVVDNSDRQPSISPQQLEESGRQNRIPCKLITNPANPGPARAFNQGIEYAIKQKYNFVLLLDQDSRPEPEMVVKLLRAQKKLTALGSKIALVGPALFDPRSERLLAVTRYGWFGEKKIVPDAGGEHFVPADCLISSGSLIAADVLVEVGLMDEHLVIDDVDFEWCFRAAAKDYRCYAISNAILEHQVGDDTRHIPLLNIELFVHSPRRQYYIMRNHVLLLRRSYSPWGWKMTTCKDILLRLGFFALFVRPRLTNLYMMLKGLGHGLMGK